MQPGEAGTSKTFSVTTKFVHGGGAGSYVVVPVSLNIIFIAGVGIAAIGAIGIMAIITDKTIAKLNRVFPFIFHFPPI
jgi:cephalosporin-C deacetylase-like acetyl esterase